MNYPAAELRGILLIKPGINPVPDAGGFVIPLPPRISDVKHLVVINIKIRLGNNAQPFVIIPFPQIQIAYPGQRTPMHANRLNRHNSPQPLQIPAKILIRQLKKPLALLLWDLSIIEPPPPDPNSFHPSIQIIQPSRSSPSVFCPLCSDLRPLITVSRFS